VATQQLPTHSDWEALEDAFEKTTLRVHSYLNLMTGEVLPRRGRHRDPEMHSRILPTPRYMRIERQSRERKAKASDHGLKYCPRALGKRNRPSPYLQEYDMVCSAIQRETEKFGFHLLLFLAGWMLWMLKRLKQAMALGGAAKRQNGRTVELGTQTTG